MLSDNLHKKNPANTEKFEKFENTTKVSRSSYLFLVATEVMLMKEPLRFPVTYRVVYWNNHYTDLDLIRRSSKK